MTNIRINPYLTHNDHNQTQGTHYICKIALWAASKTNYTITHLTQEKFR